MPSTPHYLYTAAREGPDPHLYAALHLHQWSAPQLEEALQHAVDAGSLSRLNLLLDAGAWDSEGEAILQAVRRNDVACVTRLVDHTDSKGIYFAVMEAGRRNHVEVLPALLATGVSMQYLGLCLRKAKGACADALRNAFVGAVRRAPLVDRWVLHLAEMALKDPDNARHVLTHVDADALAQGLMTQNVATSWPWLTALARVAPDAFSVTIQEQMLAQAPAAMLAELEELRSLVEARVLHASLPPATPSRSPGIRL